MSSKLAAMTQQEEIQARSDAESQADDQYMASMGVKVDAQGVPVYDQNGQLSFDPKALSSNLQQNNIGDCFLVSSLQATTQSPDAGKASLAKDITPQVQYDANGNPSVSYQVTLPGEKSKPQTVSAADLGLGTPSPSPVAAAGNAGDAGNAQNTGGGGKSGPSANPFAGALSSPSTNPVPPNQTQAYKAALVTDPSDPGQQSSIASGVLADSVKAGPSFASSALGDQILEVAYAKTQPTQSPGKNSPNLGALNNISQGGDPATALSALTGKPTQDDETSSFNGQVDLAKAINDPSRYAVVLSTFSKEPPGNSAFVSGHAYALSVDPKTKQLTAVNPWDTSADRTPVSTADVKKYFQYVSITDLSPPKSSPWWQFWK